MRATFLFPFLVTAAAGQASKVYSDHDEGVMVPRVLEKIEPDYTEEARRARLEGTAEIGFVVEADGSLRDVHVARSLGLGLDEKAVDAVKGWHFAPATKDGKPVAALTSVEVNFRMLTARTDWHLTRADFDAAQDASRPVVTNPDFPPPASRDENATAVVSFDVDTHGVPVNLHVEFISDDKWERDVISAMRGWRFQPAAIPVRGTFRFSVGQPPARSNKKLF